MQEYPPLTKEQVREYADNFLRFLDANTGKVPADNWYDWRVSLGAPYQFDRENGERRIREFLVHEDCITNPKDAYTRIVELRPNGRRALDFDGGPKAFWENADRIFKLSAQKLEKDAAKDHPLWKWVDRLNKLLPIPTAIVAVITLSTQMRQCSQPHSPGQEAAHPAPAQSSALDSQSVRPTSPTDTLSNSSSNVLNP